MNFQNLKKKDTCSASAATFMSLLAYVAIVDGKDVLGAGHDIPLIWIVLALFLVTLALLAVCSLLDLFTNWLSKLSR